MADINYNDIPNIETDWQGYSGQSVQKFIKEQLQSKVGVFYYDATNNRYLVFASESTKNEYILDPTKTDLVLGTFDAPFNYSAEINLASNTYNAVFLGSVGNYIDFTFKIVNKQGADTGENVNITYTFLRNAIKQTVTETRKAGESIHFNVDKYLGEGTNTVMVSLVGQNTLAATSIAITYQVVNLSLTDEYDISNVYNITNGAATMEIPFTVSGYGTKIMEWYIDGEKLAYVKNEDECVDSTVSRTKHITISNLQQGRHSLQLRAYTTVNGEAFYTPTLYRDFFVYTSANSTLMLGVATTIPVGYGVLGADDSVALYGVVQYEPYTLRFASYSPTNQDATAITITLDGESKGVVSSSNGIENSFTFIPMVSGSKVLQLTANDVTYTIPVNIVPTSMDIEEITSSLAFAFDAMGKTNNSTDRDTWTDGIHTGTLNGFNYNDRSGWVNGRLEINAGASFSIDFAPLANNPTSSGCTVEMEWSTKNVSNDDAVICDLRNEDGAGILITATKVSLISANGVRIDTEYKSGENVRVGFVINRSVGVAERRLSYIYTNGIVSRGDTWGSTDSYTSPKTITFSGSIEAEVSLKAIRVYNTALTANNILNNFILYRDSVNEMMEVYDRNDIYEEGSSVFSVEKMSSRLPVMVVTGDIPTLENTSDKDTQIVVDIEYINMQDPSKSFKMVNAAMRPQGTSSMGYPKKNFRIYTQKLDSTIVYDANGNEIEDKLYSFKDGAQPVDCWCLKADYAESSGTHNTGIARLWNEALFNAQIDGEYKLRTEAQKKALEAGYKYDVRTTIDGFPILLFYRPSANDELIFIGKYNFNNDKSTESVFGFTGIPNFDNSRMQCWEVLNNGNPLALFTTTEGFDSGWSEAFESRYPDTKTPNTADLKAFCQWMTTVSKANFATEKWQHLNVYMMAAYWVYLMRHAAADQFVKNAMFTSEDGQHFYYILYDNDTINGLVNTGKLLIPPTATRTTVDESGEYVFAGHGSRLWDMLEVDEEFISIVSTVDNALYSAGISYANTIKIFDNEQADKWVERVYNQDAQYKYVNPFTERGVNNLFMLQGKRDLHRRWWLAKRFSIYDAKYVSGTYKSQAVELKCINNTPAGQKFTIKAGYPLDYGYGINNVPRSFGISLNVGESHTFSTSEVVNLGDPIRIYGASNIAELDLSEMAARLAVVTVTNVYDEANGTKLTKLIVGKAGVSNMEVADISGLKQAIALEYLDVQGMTKINSIDLSAQKYLKTLKAKGSGISSITFANGAPIERLELPSAMRVLELSQLPYLNSADVVLENVANLQQIIVSGCPNISDDFAFVYNWYLKKNTSNEDSVLVMDNITWEDIDVQALIEITNIKNLNLKGKVVLNSITYEELNRLKAVFGESAFDPNSEFVISVPNAVFISGVTEILEGNTAQYSCITFGNTIDSIRWEITSGGNSYTSIDKDSGLLTVSEGSGNRTLVISAIVAMGDKVITQTISVAVTARVYPSASDTTITGPARLNPNQTEYGLSYSNAVNGTIEATWSLTGMDGYAEIISSDNEGCTIQTTMFAGGLVQGTLTCSLKKKYNNSALFTLSKTIELLNDNIAETDSGICQALFNAGLCANNTYITKEEAALITADDLQPGSSYDSSIFYAQKSSIKSFDGFKFFVGIDKVKDHTFYRLEYLISIELPESCTMIGSRAFSYCSVLKNVSIPNSVTSLGNNAFDNCSGFTSINIPEGVTSIGQGAFYGCSKLQMINILGSITSISGQLFSYCRALTSFIIPPTVKSIGGDAFKDCASLSSIIIPEGVNEIKGGAFYGCHSLNELYIPSTVSSIDTSALDYTGLLNIIVSDDNNTYSSIDGVLFNKTKTELIRYAKDSIQPTYVTPAGVTAIGEEAFSTCSSLSSVIISEGVTEVNGNAFNNCKKLTSISLPSSLVSIGSYAFAYCSSLREIYSYALNAPTLSYEVFRDSISKVFVLKIPILAVGYDLNRWSEYSGYFTVEHLYEPTECISLNITANDVPGRQTTTSIYWVAMTNGIDLMTNQVINDYELSGVAKSEPFPQNTSTTDTVQREITFTYLGVTASTIITQGVWAEYEYALNLNNEWRKSSAVANPDSALYDGVYESYSNYNVNSGLAFMYIDIFGYNTFKLYIRSYAESTYDYVMVSKLDMPIDGDTSYTNGLYVKAHTRGNQQSGTAISSYTLVEFTGITAGYHRITVMYKKDYATNKGDDRAYILIPKNQ